MPSIFGLAEQVEQLMVAGAQRRLSYGFVFCVVIKWSVEFVATLAISQVLGNIPYMNSRRVICVFCKVYVRNSVA